MWQLAGNDIAVGAQEKLCQRCVRQNKEAVDNALWQEQAGFRPGRSCNDQIFTLRRILETVTAGRNTTIFNFIDFCKAFDSVHRPALWKILRMYGFPEEIISILQNLYQDSKCAVRTIGDTSEWFNVQTGDRQGCILSPLLFAIVMDWVMRQSTISRDFSLIWFGDTRLTDLDIADDVVLIYSDVNRLQELTTAVEQEASKVGLFVNSNKCCVMVSGG